MQPLPCTICNGAPPLSLILDGSKHIKRLPNESLAVKRCFLAHGVHDLVFLAGPWHATAATRLQLELFVNNGPLAGCQWELQLRR